LRTESYELIFLYDVNNTHIGFLLDGIEYFYLTDLLGNIISILAEDGTEMVKYEYDAYGNIINSPTGILSDINPYTYRGYRYDSEIGMYYLNSRYYNPQSGLFFSSDGTIGQIGYILSTNMYAYCGNNPVTFVDPSGRTQEVGSGGTFILSEEEEKILCIMECQERAMQSISQNDLLVYSLIGVAILYGVSLSFWHPTDWLLIGVLIIFYVVSYVFLSVYNVVAEIDQGLCNSEFSCSIP